MEESEKLQILKKVKPVYFGELSPAEQKKKGSISKAPASSKLLDYNETSLIHHYSRLVRNDFKHPGDLKDYIDSAEKNGRPLTEQEFALKRKKQVEFQRNHIISYDHGRDITNRNTLNFIIARDTALAAQRRLNSPTNGNIQMNRRQVLSGLSSQVASVARQQGISRAIISHSDPDDNIRSNLRNETLRHTLQAFQHDDINIRKNKLRDLFSKTFNSLANMRLGHPKGNIKIGPGLDLPLDHEGRITERGLDTLKALYTYAPSDFLSLRNVDELRLGQLVTLKDSRPLSSSRQVMPKTTDSQLPAQAANSQLPVQPTNSQSSLKRKSSASNSSLRKQQKIM